MFSSASRTARAWSPKLRKAVALADVLGAFFSRERRTIEGDVANEIERVEFFADLLGQGVEQDSVLFEFLDDRLFLFGLRPAREKRIERSEFFAHRLSCVGFEGFGDEFSILTVILDALGYDPYGHVIHDVFDPPVTCVRVDHDVRWFFPHGREITIEVSGFAMVGGFRVIRWDRRVVALRLVNHDRKAVEFRIGEELGRLLEVNDGEPELS